MSTTTPSTLAQGHIFEGQPDSRQGDAKTHTSRFRPKYRALTPPEISLHNALKTKAQELEALIEQVPTGRYRSLAFTALEESIMWAVKQLTA
jgi:hypothetical protein